MSSNKIRISRSNVSGNRLPNTQSNEGVPYVNLADKQFGVHDTAGQAHDLVGVRFHSSFANYNAGDLVVYGDVIYNCIISHNARSFDINYWTDISPKYQVENDCINGTCSAWQRNSVDDGTVSRGYVTIDRFIKYNSVITSKLELGVFVAGQQDVPRNPERYMDYKIINQCDPNDGYEILDHRVLDGARRYSGGSVVFKFHVKGPAGSSVVPALSRSVNGATLDLGLYKDAVILTGGWQEIVVVFDAPPLTSAIQIEQMNFMDFRIWFSAGSTWGAAAHGLTVQTGTFSVAEVEIYSGDRALSVRRKSEAEELDNCLKYYMSFRGNNIESRVFGTGEITQSTGVANILFEDLRTMIQAGTMGPSSIFLEAAGPGTPDYSLTSQIKINNYSIASCEVSYDRRFLVATLSANQEGAAGIGSLETAYPFYIDAEI